MFEDKGGLDEPLVKDTNCFKKHLKTIIFLFIGIIVISAVIILIIVLKDDDDDDDDEDQKKPFEFGLTMEELKRKTNPDYMYHFVLLKPTSEEYLSLKEGDKEALKYLVKAGMILENINYRIDEIHNIPFKKFLEEEIKKGNEQAKLTKMVFDGQKGINAVDIETKEINLAKGIKLKPGMGVYPEDITKKELHDILIKMLKEDKIEEVRKILNQRSIVERDGEYLKATDYVDFFKDEFSQMADLFDKAANCSTNENFSEYLELQAAAFRDADPILDAYADIKWAELQYTPLELTITRENYLDELTGSFIENEELKKLLEDNDINPVPKDQLGFRLGIINKEGTDIILGIKKYLPMMAENMPLSDTYEQSISTNETAKQTMVDADLVMLAGQVGAFRAGITLAENLPNDDKLSLTMGGGRRNVYHRQVREGAAGTPEAIKKYLDLILDKDLHKYYDYEANHWFVILHENAHSLGPIIKNDNLGDYSHIVEENKADLGGLIFLDLFVNESYYTQEQKNKIIVTFIVDEYLDQKPVLSQEHLVRSVMQIYYLTTKGGIEIKDEKIHINLEKIVSIATEMMTEAIEVQLANNFQKGKEFVEKYFQWTDDMELIAKKKLSLSNPHLNAKIDSELADKLLKED